MLALAPSANPCPRLTSSLPPGGNDWVYHGDAGWGELVIVWLRAISGKGMHDESST